MNRLIVVPSDPIADYENAGYGSWLAGYYNPGGLFEEVFALSPLESGERSAHGMTIRGVGWSDLREEIERIGPEVVRAYGGYWPADYVMQARVEKVPVVVSLHDTRPDAFHDSIPLADLVICMSGAVRERALAVGANEHKLVDLPNRVDASKFYPRSPEQTAPIARRFGAGRHILHVGRRTEQKNADTLIEALALLTSDYRATFVGRGDATPYRELAAARGVANRCTFIDAVCSDELPNWLSWCDCFCVPSRHEGFGIVFVEAAACGAPIVTSGIAPMNEYLTHGQSALLVDRFEDPHAVANAVRRVCEDTALAERLRKGAVAAAAPFEARTVDAREAQIYQQVVAGQIGAPPSVAELTRWKLKHAARRGARKILRPLAGRQER